MEELVPGVDEEIKEVDSRERVKYNDRSDQLLLEAMMM